MYLNCLVGWWLGMMVDVVGMMLWGIFDNEG